jgi:hypothetical protein
MNWFHKLLNPHCEHCRDESRENKVCLSCETLKSELAAVRFQNEQLMKNILEIVHPAPVPLVERKEVEFKPLVTSWRVKQQMLQENDRLAAAAMKAKKAEMYESSKSTQQLEKELLGEADALG